MKFTLKGSIKVKLGLKDGMFLKVNVIDTGIGMKPELLQNLFSPFAKGEDKEGMNKAGCGLGLAVSRSLAENLGGYITAKSVLGVGSTFTFTVTANLDGEISTTAMGRTMIKPSQFSRAKCGIYGKVKRQFTSERPSLKIKVQVEPINHAAARASLQTIHKRIMSEESEREGVKCSCPKILVVDDTPLNVFALKQQLAKLGFPADEASNGLEALEKVRLSTKKACCKCYKLILMDCNMPVMDGIEATQKINELIVKREIKYIPIIGLSAYSGEAELKSCIDAGMSETLCKPVSSAKLDDILVQYGLKFKKSLFKNENPTNV